MNLPCATERLRDVLRRQHKSLSTEASYVYWLRHYVTALKTMPGSLTSEQKLGSLTRFIVGAKAGKDRVVGIPPSLVPELVQQMKLAQAVWLRDKQNQIPVDLPFQLSNSQSGQPDRGATPRPARRAGRN
jgi:hypothetical protein